ncbi:NADH dehydrogenase [ubiquinone] complex I, assembly factor 7 [Candida viswanathii]|uniref:Protein arginine methyltransferase NDUFAF7 n=1 Tax=Candida viswanathii TaxID=5486 RepID=A0A367YGE7_9ASCO|nr:NADH dehydrogenase [ubiquinone] complex I, assembly factor 7 [Candida viswanathii]
MIFKRHLFKGKPKIIEKTDFHHEYSIRPDTFAFKVPSPAKTMNPIQAVYRYATNFPFEGTPESVYNSYPMTNSAKLAKLKQRPKRVKMTTGDFIEDSLYHPKYGYFSQLVEIYQSEKPFDYNNIEDIDEFMENWSKSYERYEENAPVLPQETASLPAPKTSSKFAAMAYLIQKQDRQVAMTGHRKSLQLWHTPTELFHPYYGEALARYILVNYKLNIYPYEDLIIYEMGGGNGTLMCDILNYIRKNHPEIYERTQYRIIEISSQLASKQMKQALDNKLASRGLDKSKLEIYNKSIFEWKEVVPEPCFFIALEVFDNFPHDLIRYDNTTGQPYEGKVLVDQHGDFYEFFTSDLSRYSDAYLRLRENGKHSVLKQSSTLGGHLGALRSLVSDDVHPLLHSSAMLKLKNMVLPYDSNLTPGEFIPTRLLQFFQILKHKFPNHLLISSDFHYLPKKIPGCYNGPVVQTVLKNDMVDVSTYMVLQGYFDIMFATDFGIASEMYKQVTSKVPRVESHRDFLEQWADVDVTTTKAGENPMLDFYRNVSFMVS